MHNSKKKEFSCYKCQNKVVDRNELEYIDKYYYENSIRQEILISDLWGILDEFISQNYECEICKTAEKIKFIIENAEFDIIEYDNNDDECSILIKILSFTDTDEIKKQIYKILVSANLKQESWIEILKKADIIKKRNHITANTDEIENDDYYLVSKNKSGTKNCSLKSKREQVRHKKKYYTSLGQRKN